MFGIRRLFSMTEESDQIEQLKLQADAVRSDEYWTGGLDIAPHNQPLVHRDMRGELNIRVQNIPTSTDDNLICWVQIVEGDLFTGVGKLIVDSFTEDSLEIPENSFGIDTKFHMIDTPELRNVVSIIIS